MGKIVRTVGAVIIFLIAVVLLVVGVVNRIPADETPLARAYRVCMRCGLQTDEVSSLVDIMRDSPLSREGLIELWERTYADPDTLDQARELCGPCVDAVLAVAESEKP